MKKSYVRLAQAACLRLSPGHLDRDSICTAVCPPEGLMGCFHNEKNEERNKVNECQWDP